MTQLFMTACLAWQVGVWTGISYALKGHPPGIVRRLALPNTWDYYSFWSTPAVRLASPNGCLALPQDRQGLLSETAWHVCHVVFLGGGGGGINVGRLAILAQSGACVSSGCGRLVSGLTVIWHLRAATLVRPCAATWA